MVKTRTMTSPALQLLPAHSATEPGTPAPVWPLRIFTGNALRPILELLLLLLRLLVFLLWHFMLSELMTFYHIRWHLEVDEICVISSRLNFYTNWTQSYSWVFFRDVGVPKKICSYWLAESTLENLANLSGNDMEFMILLSRINVSLI